MAEDEDGVSNKKSSQNSNNAGPSADNEQNTTKPDLGIEEAKYNSAENGDTTPDEPKSSTSKSTGTTRKEDNPFSFRHFLKRDLSLPGNSTYENTGARPKVYASTVQHSPTKLDLRRSPSPHPAPPAAPPAAPAPSPPSASASSVEIPFAADDDTEAKPNAYSYTAESPFYHRPNLASEPLGMPSLPDFVQDHILVEQAYLNSNGPISVDLDNLPDFTFNTNYNVGSSSVGRRGNGGYGSSRSYDYESYMGGASSSGFGEERSVPLDLPAGAEAAPAVQPPPHLSLDLTESVNPADRRNMSPRNNFPLDLPPNAGAEAMRLPDFLPVHPGRTSPEPEHQDDQLQQILAELERTRSELFLERNRRSRAESSLVSVREELAAARLQRRHERDREREREREYSGHMDSASRPESNMQDVTSRATEAESTIARLKKEIKKLKEELSSSQAEVRSLRRVQTNAATDLRHAASVADTSLRDLLAGLERLRSLSSTLDPT